MKKVFTGRCLMDHSLLLLCLTACSSAAVYRLYGLDAAGIALSLALAAAAYYSIRRLIPPPEGNDGDPAVGEAAKPAGPDRQSRFLILFYFVLLAAAFFTLWQGRTGAPIISPWQAVSPYFFALYASAGMCLLVLAARGRAFALPLISLYFFLAFAVALVVYRLGYGFDPFVHRATAELIAAQGAVSPKPFYYLGQYGLSVILHKVFFLPVSLADKLLVPLLAALYLPFYFYRLLKSWFWDERTALPAILLLLALPYSFLIVTTPQNLAYLFLLLALLTGLAGRSGFELALACALATAALLTQPIAGLPALGFVLLLTVYHSDLKKLKKYLYGLIFAGLALALPLAFYVVEKSGAGTAPAPGPAGLGLGSLKDHFLLSMPGRENFVLNFLYLLDSHAAYLLLLPALAGFLIARRYRDKCRALGLCLFAAAAMVLAFLLVRLLPFAFLIDYERSDYPGRFLTVATLFILPFALIAAGWLVNKINRQEMFFKTAWAIFAALLLAAGLYLSYPRFDPYYNSRLYAVSDSDLSAVRWIEEDAAGADYIALANQQVSAAALRESGFKKYYPPRNGNGATEVFYYPVPTGGPLYQYYLAMVYEKPSREIALKAMDLAGVDNAYFVLNEYWWAFPKILAEAKLSADYYKAIDKGAVYVFKYRR